MHLNLIDPPKKIFRDFWVSVLSSLLKNEISEIMEILQKRLLKYQNIALKAVEMQFK